MDFFARQEQTRRTSRLLVGAFLLSFIVCALATTIAGAVALRLYTENNALFLGTETWADWLAGHFTLVAAVAGGTLRGDDPREPLSSGVAVVGRRPSRAHARRDGGHG